MIKLHIDIQLIRILYNRYPTKSHYTNFILQTQEGDQLYYEQKFITTKTDIVQLDKLAPFRLFLVVGNNKMTLCPFQLTFITKTQPQVTRKMPIHQGHILKHYLNHEIFTDVEPLEQIYTFEGGEIIYSVVVIESQTISDSEEFSKLSSQFKKSASILSEQMRNSGGMSNNESRNFEQKDTGVTSNFITAKEQTNSQYLNLPNIDLKSRRSMSMMSIEQIAEQIQMNTVIKEESMSSSMVKSDKWYFKLASKTSNQKENIRELHKTSQNKLKMVVLLIAIGLGLLLFDFINDKRFTIRGGPKSMKKKGSKVKKSTIKV